MAPIIHNHASMFHTVEPYTPTSFTNAFVSNRTHNELRIKLLHARSESEGTALTASQVSSFHASACTLPMSPSHLSSSSVACKSGPCNTDQTDNQTLQNKRSACQSIAAQTTSPAQNAIEAFPASKQPELWRSLLHRYALASTEHTTGAQANCTSV